MKFSETRSKSSILHVFPFNSEKKRGGIAVHLVIKTSNNYDAVWYIFVRVPSPTGDSTQVIGMRGRGQGSVVAAAASWSRGGESTATTAVELGHSWLLEEAGNKYIILLPLFRRGDYIFIVLGLYK
jgi:hypothetical protein